ncbi:MAG: metallophosphoesterase [Candidatus Woesearchaeota archaeon]
MRVAFCGDLHYSSSRPRARQDEYQASLLKKLDSVYQENDVVIFLGDMFSAPTVSSEYYRHIFQRFMKTQVARGKKTFSILGNHEIIGYNTEMYHEKTFIGTLEMNGYLKVIHEHIIINGWKIDVIPLKSHPVLPFPTQANSILLGHCGFEHPRDLDLSIHTEEILQTGYDFLILGHDHEAYPTLNIGKTVMIRPGSLARNAAFPYNLRRMPQYVQFVFDHEKLKGYKLIPVVGALDPREVFCPEAFKDPESYTEVYFAELEKIIVEFGKKIYSSKLSLRKFLQDLECPEPVILYIESHYKNLGLRFS